MYLNDVHQLYLQNIYKDRIDLATSSRFKFKREMNQNHQLPQGGLNKQSKPARAPAAGPAEPLLSQELRDGSGLTDESKLRQSHGTQEVASFL